MSNTGKEAFMLLGISKILSLLAITLKKLLLRSPTQSSLFENLCYTRTLSISISLITEPISGKMIRSIAS